MNTSEKYFYVINIDDDVNPYIYAFVNTLRLIASPHTKNEAHVTVIGPRDEPLGDDQKEAYNETLEDKSLIINGVGRFFNPGQSTVYLSCRPDLEEVWLEKVWSKPDYNGMKPHLTIYDGKYRKFAQKIFDKLNNNMNICFSIDDMELKDIDSEKKTKKRAQDSHLMGEMENWMIRLATGREISKNQIPNLDDQEKINLISDVWSTLGLIEKEVKGCITNENLKEREKFLMERTGKSGHQRTRLTKAKV
jgi:2'-5' RNA ligase